MSEQLKCENVAWTLQRVRMLSNGGQWGVPRSGLVFQKKGEALALVARMPHDANMPITAAQLAEYQQSDFDVIKEHCRAAGITCTDDTIPAGPPIFYECGICDHYHPWDWNGDCREDANRFTRAVLDARFGPNGWIERSMVARCVADLEKQS